MSFDEHFSLIGLAQIVWVDLLLSADNAVVIALACRGLPEDKRRLGAWLGAGAAIVLRIVLTAGAALLMRIPGLQIVSAAALLWVAATLVQDEDHEGHVASSANLWRAVRTIAIADTVMSLDNALAIAAIAGESWLLLGLGLALSIPLIVAGSSLVLKLIDRFPIVIWAGCGLLGWVAGELFAHDHLLHGIPFFDPDGPAELICGAAGVVLALAGGWVAERRSRTA